MSGYEKPAPKLPNVSALLKPAELAPELNRSRPRLVLPTTALQRKPINQMKNLPPAIPQRPVQHSQAPLQLKSTQKNGIPSVPSRPFQQAGSYPVVGRKLHTAQPVPVPNPFRAANPGLDSTRHLSVTQRKANVPTSKVPTLATQAKGRDAASPLRKIVQRSAPAQSGGLRRATRTHNLAISAVGGAMKAYWSGSAERNVDFGRLLNLKNSINTGNKAAVHYDIRELIYVEVGGSATKGYEAVTTNPALWDIAKQVCQDLGLRLTEDLGVTSGLSPASSSSSSPASSASSSPLSTSMNPSDSSAAPSPLLSALGGSPLVVAPGQAVGSAPLNALSSLPTLHAAATPQTPGH